MPFIYVVQMYDLSYCLNPTEHVPDVTGRCQDQCNGKHVPDVTGRCQDQCNGKPNGDYQSLDNLRPFYYHCDKGFLSYRTCRPNEIFNAWTRQCGECSIARLLAVRQTHYLIRSIEN